MGAAAPRPSLICQMIACCHHDRGDQRQVEADRGELVHVHDRDEQRDDGAENRDTENEFRCE